VVLTRPIAPCCSRGRGCIRAFSANGYGSREGKLVEQRERPFVLIQSEPKGSNDGEARDDEARGGRHRGVLPPLLPIAGSTRFRLAHLNPPVLKSVHAARARRSSVCRPCVRGWADWAQHSHAYGPLSRRRRRCAWAFAIAGGPACNVHYCPCFARCVCVRAPRRPRYPLAAKLAAGQLFLRRSSPA